MTNESVRLKQNEELIKRLFGAMRTSQLYSHEHPLVRRSVDRLKDAIVTSSGEDGSIVIGIVGDDLVVGDIPLGATTDPSSPLQRLRSAGVERITIEREATSEEVQALVLKLAELQSKGERALQDVFSETIGEHIRLGQLVVERGRGGIRVDATAAQQQYRDSVAQAQILLEEARQNGMFDPDMATAIVEGLAQALAQHRTAVLALTALKHYDNYTFTHVVNVAILTMAQARSFGIEDRLIQVFGLAGFMHDIGKILVPTEILNKPEKLTDQEKVIMRRHPIDGAMLLRRRPELPPLAAAVALEHHLRIDGTGYPAITRPSLNLATQLTSIADTYDAMRSLRVYQDAFPSERILAVLEGSDGQYYDPLLVRRFCQLLGIYPPGTVVRLGSGDIAVVVRTHAPDPHRPAVRVVLDAEGRKLATPYDVALWLDECKAGTEYGIVGLVDPADVDFNPLTYLDVSTP